jgi:glycine/D-amino acid oxidase-like deaminating enzyme
MFDHLKPTSGFAMSSVVVEVSKYLPELYRFLAQDYRVRFIKKKIHSIIELKDKADVVINCTGLASRYLVGDQTIRPARGQVYLIKIIFFLNHFFLFYLDYSCSCSMDKISLCI